MSDRLADRASFDREVNLLLVNQTSHVGEGDFQEIAGVVKAGEPRVHPYVLRDRPYPVRNLWFARRPSLVFAACVLKRYRPGRGANFAPKVLPKSEEYRRLEAAGVPVPRWALLSRTDTPDVTTFGPYAVEKPDLGVSGAEVRIVRSHRLRWKAPRVQRLGQTESEDRVVQEFIYTGRWPVSYRVVTLFGEALACFRMEADHDRTPLPDRFAFREAGGGRSIVASSRGCAVRLQEDEEVIRFAEDAHRAFPDRALLGFDVLREVPSGRLYVIEANTTGHTWHLSSQAARRIHADTGEDPKRQRDGLARAARVLAEKAPLLAE